LLISTEIRLAEPTRMAVVRGSGSARFFFGVGEVSRPIGSPRGLTSTFRGRLDPVAYAIDLLPLLSATPVTLIGDVGGVSDRLAVLSVASVTGWRSCRWRR
jgi:hypothetical protein